jgi:hypothetical protein
MQTYVRSQHRPHGRAAARQAVCGAHAPLQIALVGSLAAAVLWLALVPARAASEVAVDEGGIVVDEESSGGGMPRSNPRVKPILAAHPNQNVVICVAGCGGKARPVQVLPRVVSARTGMFVPSSARMGDSVYGPRQPGSSGRLRAVTRADDVVCIAGCSGKPGQIVQQLPDLPPRSQPAPVKSKSKDGSKPTDDGIDDLLP